VGLAYADDETLRTLNSRYRKLDRTTDVLSFTYEDEIDGDGRRVLGGDIILSVPRLLAQAKRYKVTPGRELARLLTHGALHLCGHDHKQAGERQRMREREKIHLDAMTKSEEIALTRLVDSWASTLD
jgi:probable rRNA maturation factor